MFRKKITILKNNIDQKTIRRGEILCLCKTSYEKFYERKYVQQPKKSKQYKPR